MKELVTVEPCLNHLRVRLGKMRMKFEHLIEILRNDGIEEKDILKALPYQIRSFIREGWAHLDADVYGTNVLGVPTKQIMIKHHAVTEVRAELEHLQLDIECLSATIKRYSPAKTKQTPKQKLLATMNRDNTSTIPKTNKYWFTKTGKAEFEDALERYRLK